MSAPHCHRWTTHISVRSKAQTRAWEFKPTSKTQMYNTVCVNKCIVIYSVELLHSISSTVRDTCIRGEIEKENNMPYRATEFRTETYTILCGSISFCLCHVWGIVCVCVVCLKHLIYQHNCNVKSNIEQNAVHMPRCWSHSEFKRLSKKRMHGIESGDMATTWLGTNSLTHICTFVYPLAA